MIEQDKVVFRMSEKPRASNPRYETAPIIQAVA